MATVYKKLALIGILVVIHGIFTIYFSYFEPVRAYGLLSLILGILILLVAVKFFTGYFTTAPIIPPVAFAVVTLYPLRYVINNSKLFFCHLWLGIFYIIIFLIYLYYYFKYNLGGT